MSTYPTYAQLRTSRIETRRRAALGVLRDAEATARAAGARLLVFGSLAEGRFHEGSDLDIAVLGLPSGADAELAVEIDTAIRLAGFSADVIPERFLSSSLRDRIMRHGKEPSALG